MFLTNRVPATKFAMRALGRSLQHLGLILPLASILLQLGNIISVRDMLLMLVAGVVSFSLGRLVEGYGR